MCRRSATRLPRSRQSAFHSLTTTDVAVQLGSKLDERRPFLDTSYVARRPAKCHRLRSLPLRCEFALACLHAVVPSVLSARASGAGHVRGVEVPCSVGHRGDLARAAMGCFISTEKRTQRVTKNSSFKFLTVRAAARRRRLPEPAERRAARSLAATRRRPPAAGALRAAVHGGGPRQGQQGASQPSLRRRALTRRTHRC